MKDEDNVYLEANRAISKENEKLRKENHELWYFKERFEHQIKVVEELKRQLDIKRNVLLVQEKKGNVLYNLRVLKVHDTPDGLIIQIG